MLTASSLSSRDAAVIAEWQAALTRAPGVLPSGLEPVQTRLIRAVARGRLPDVGDVFVKTMGFPRGRDRLRYWLRPLPALHEAAMLQAVAAAGVPCPEVLHACGVRMGLGRPHVSLLVTRAVEHDPSRAPELHACAEVARRMADAGLLHGDLHGGNFLVRADGGVSVLDLQSVRRRWMGVSKAARRRLAARLLAHDWTTPARPVAVVEAGLIEVAALPGALAAAHRWRWRALQRRIRRCLTESSDFVVQRRGLGWFAQRRRLPAGGRWIETGKPTRRIWLGQRVAEVLADERPLVSAVFWNSWWLPGRGAVYIADPSGVALFHEKAQRWLDALRRYEKDGCGAIRGVPADAEAPLSWSVRREV